MVWLDTALEFIGMSTLMSEPKVKEGTQELFSYDQCLKFNYRPETLDKYIGQKNTKMLVELNLRKIKYVKPVHIILSGHKGHGKTTMAYIIANELGLPLTYKIGGNFTMDDLREFLLTNIRDKEQMHILFIDEIHNIDKKLAEFMYPVIEDFKMEDTPIKPFILLGATTEKSTLLDNIAPFVDRCVVIDLECYTAQDIAKIVEQYNKQIYRKDVHPEVYQMIGMNCRYTPRIALSLFDDYIVEPNIHKILKMRQIIRDSLTKTDIQILIHLAEVGKPVGEEALSMIANVVRKDYKSWIEPFLVRENYISRTLRGRIISDKGIKLLEELKNENEI